MPSLRPEVQLAAATRSQQCAAHPARRARLRRRGAERCVPQRLVRLRAEHGLYREENLRGDVPDADAVSHRHSASGRGADRTYDVEIKLFSDGALVTRTETAFEIVKVGFEQFVATTARQNGFNLRAGDGVHGADDRLDGLDRVPQGLIPHGEEAHRRQVYAACADLAASPSRTMRPHCIILRDARKSALLRMRPVYAVARSRWRRRAREIFRRDPKPSVSNDARRSFAL